MFDGAAGRRDIQLFNFDARREFLQTHIQAGALHLQLDFFRRQFFEPHPVALLLQIERGDFISDSRQILRGGKRRRLGGAKLLLIFALAVFDLLQTLALGLQTLLVLFERHLGNGEPLRDGNQFTRGRVATLLSLRDFREGFGILLLNFRETFLIKLNAALMAINVGLQFQAALLLRGNFMLEFGKQFAQFGNLILKPQHIIRAGFNFVPQIFHIRLTFGNLALKNIELMPRQLRFQMLQLLRNLFVAPRLASLTLK